MLGPQQWAAIGQGAMGIGMFLGHAFRKPPKDITMGKFSPSTLQATNLARQQNNLTMAPGQDQASAMANRDGANLMSNARRSTRSSTQLMGSLGNLRRYSSDVTLGLQKQNADFRQASFANYMGAINNQANQEARLSTLNEQRRQAFQQDRAAGMAGGLNTVSASLSSFAGSSGGGNVWQPPQQQISLDGGGSLNTPAFQQQMMGQLQSMNQFQPSSLPSLGSFNSLPSMPF